LEISASVGFCCKETIKTLDISLSKLVYIDSELPHVSAKYVAVFRDINYKV